jgi:hypothetical protein
MSAKPTIKFLGWEAFLVIALLFNGFVTACTRDRVLSDRTAQPSASETANPPGTDKTGWVTLVPGQSTDSLKFEKDGTLRDRGKVLLEQIPVSYSSDGSVSYASSLVVSPPSPVGDFTLIKACDREPEGLGLCWAVFLLDRQQGTARQTQAGKYGPEQWVQWSKDRRYAVLASTTDRNWWLHAIDLQSGDSSSFDFGAHKPELSSFSWLDGSKFQIQQVRDRATFSFQGNIAALFEEQLSSCTVGSSESQDNCPDSSMKESP